MSPSKYVPREGSSVRSGPSFVQYTVVKSTCETSTAIEVTSSEPVVTLFALP
jgi:hypothetical protein